MRRACAVVGVCGRLLPVAVLFVAVSGATVGATDSWPMQGHGPTRTGRSTAAGPGALSLKWTCEPINDFWGFTTATQDNGNPVVGPDGSVYQPADWAFFAINPDGTKRWESDDRGMRAAPALSCDGSQVYVVEGTGSALELRARSTLTGSLDWALAIDSWQAWLSYGSLAVGSDCAIYVAFVGWQGEDAAYPAVVAVNPNGTLRWRYENRAKRNFGIEAPPAVAPDGTVYVVENGGGLVALDPTGAVRWRRPGWGDYGWPTPMVGPDGSIYVGGEAFGTQMKVVEALRPDGTVKWRRQDLSTAGFYTGLALSADGKVVYRPSLDGTIYALDTATGATVWARRVTTDTLGGSPALSGNSILYVQGLAGAVYAVDATNGSLLWEHQYDYPSGYWGPQSPALAPDGTLYAISMGKPYPSTDHPLRIYAYAPAPKPPGLLTVGGVALVRPNHLVARGDRLRDGLQRDLRRGDPGDAHGVACPRLGLHGLGRGVHGNGGLRRRHRRVRGGGGVLHTHGPAGPQRQRHLGGRGHGHRRLGHVHRHSVHGEHVDGDAQMGHGRRHGHRLDRLPARVGHGDVSAGKTTDRDRDVPGDRRLDRRGGRDLLLRPEPSHERHDRRRSGRRHDPRRRRGHACRNVAPLVRRGPARDALRGRLQRGREDRHHHVHPPEPAGRR